MPAPAFRLVRSGLVAHPNRQATEPKDGAAPAEPELRVPLRLAVSRGALGLETYAPLELGPLSVERLDLALPNLKFPVDLSGGVKLFRHRRGRLIGRNGLAVSAPRAAIAAV